MPIMTSKQECIVPAKVKTYHTSILAQIFSPCGNYLLAGSLYGDIFVFSLRNVLNPDAGSPEKQKSCQKFLVEENNRVCSLASTSKFLIVGLRGKIVGYEWRNVISGKTQKVAWAIDIPPMKDAIELTEVNALGVTEDGKLYSGCGDNITHVHSLEDGRSVQDLVGHKDYIHDISLIEENNMLASASEDGSVHVWDLRKSKSIAVLEPHKQPRLERPNLGAWVGAVSVDKDWLVCGGGPRVGLWHLGSMQLTSTFDTVDQGVHVCRLQEDRVLIGGNSKLSQFTLQGEPVGSIPSSSPVIYSLVINQEPHMVMAMAGANPHLDICTNFLYRDQLLLCA